MGRGGGGGVGGEVRRPDFGVGCVGIRSVAQVNKRERAEMEENIQE